MKKLLVLFVVMIMLQACMFTHSHPYHAYFCTSTVYAEKRFLYIDEKKIGELPYAEIAPECEMVPSHKDAVYTVLPVGEHLVEIKTGSGEVIFSEELKLQRRMGSSTISSSVEKAEWDTRVKINDDRLVIELIH